MRVAVLSKDYEPLTYCDVERAITLIYLNKAEAVKNTELSIRSVSVTIKIPVVIRLLYKTVKKYVPSVKYSRKNIHARDDYTCQYCGVKKQLSVDHIVPVSKGGKSTWENTITACQKCNSKKGNRSPEEVGMILRKKPTKPNIIIDIKWEDFFPD